MLAGSQAEHSLTCVSLCPCPRSYFLRDLMGPLLSLMGVAALVGTYESLVEVRGARRFPFSGALGHRGWVPSESQTAALNSVRALSERRSRNVTACQGLPCDRDSDSRAAVRHAQPTRHGVRPWLDCCACSVA